MMVVGAARWRVHNTLRSLEVRYVRRDWWYRWRRWQMEWRGLLRSDVFTLCASPRVRFRADVLQQRMEEREARDAERQREEEERHNRLEALRNQVDHYLLLTLSTPMICSVSRHDPQGKTWTQPYLSWGITATFWQWAGRQFYIKPILNVFFLII